MVLPLDLTSMVQSPISAMETIFIQVNQNAQVIKTISINNYLILSTLGRLSIESRGVFSERAEGIFFDNKTAFYLVRHPEMQFVPTNSTHMMTIPGLIRINLGTPFPFALGRLWNGTNVIVGKVRMPWV